MPSDYKKYPANWKAIRARVLERAGDKCERCGVENGAVGFRTSQGRFIPKAACKVGSLHRENVISFPEHVGIMPGFFDFRIIRIVLAIVYVGPDKSPLNTDPNQWLALCQRCHNREDAADRAANRRAKSAAKETK